MGDLQERPYVLMAGGRRMVGAKAAGLTHIPAIIRWSNVEGELETEQASIPLEDIRIGERFRDDYGDMDDFIESIRDKGIITPITITDTDSYGDDELDLREIELFENVFRKDMEWHEKVKLVDSIQTMYAEKNADTPWKWSQRKCAKMLGMSATHLGRQLDLAKAIEMLPDLKKEKDEAGARKKLKQLQNKIAIAAVIKEQKEEIKAGGLKLVAMGDANYKIGDCFAGLEEIVELKKQGMGHGMKFVECDPPYAIDLVGAKKRVDNDDPDLMEYTEVERKDYKRFLDKLCDLLYDATDEDATLVFWFGSSWFTETKIAIAKSGWIIDPIPCIWNKGNGQTNSPMYYLARAYEPFFVARKGSATIRNRGRSNVFTYTPVPSGSKYHPTQRPLKLMEDIYQTFGHPGTTAIVPFAGSGVSLRAAYRNHMRVLGWDLSGEYKKQFLVELQMDEAELEKMEGGTEGATE